MNSQAKVNREDCVGCGACAGTAPAVFNIDATGKSEVIGKVVADNAEAVKEALEACPVGAISLEG